ncbi:hypothetical protein AcW1_007693 [Taiwanofungus camphoratus]|nr:hypothetical protein AcV7_009896 [Antrodia cinnamomea]KAI0953491.1 hypothetical protein AcW1_007693 [Antrodia cinnamomea]
MTSFIIKAHEGRPVPSSWRSHPDCPFCRIIRGEAPAFRLFEDDRVIAILGAFSLPDYLNLRHLPRLFWVFEDILPLRAGHTLVIPKIHYSRVSELPAEFAAASLKGMKGSKADHEKQLATQNTGLNVVCNQEYAQAVPHVHYHIIPAPLFPSNLKSDNVSEKIDRVTLPLTEKEIFHKEVQAREELDDEEARNLTEKIRARM